MENNTVEIARENVASDEAWEQLLVKCGIKERPFIGKITLIAERKHEWTGSHLVKIDGKSFFCSCGCNVFQRSITRGLHYKCNGCDTIYESE